MESYVLDAYAILCYLQDEDGADTVAALLERAKGHQVKLYISWINLGEVYYLTRREHGQEMADTSVQLIRSWPVELHVPTGEGILAAAGYKAKHPISYADAFALSLAKECGACLVTGDPEFDAVTEEVKIEPLPRQTGR